jgi:hypothetical protein
MYVPAYVYMDLLVTVSTYVCTCVCMYVRAYVCMYVCSHVSSGAVLEETFIIRLIKRHP